MLYLIFSTMAEAEAADAAISQAMGLPLVVSGQLRTVTEPAEEGASMNVQCKGVTIPFTNKDGSANLKVMIYM